MNTKDKKDKYKRRSSILKPGKSLSENVENLVNTPERMEKRVSFASSNFIKPFASGPENNTVWDTTYEEVVNFTDSTPSDHNNTQFGDTTKNLSKKETSTSSNLNNVTENYFDSTKNTHTQDMEFTRLPEIQNKKVSVKSNIVQCAKLMEPNIQDKENVIDSQMDFTCVVLNSVAENDFDSTKNCPTQEMALSRLPVDIQKENVLVMSDIVQRAKLMELNINDDKENFDNSKMEFTCALNLKSVIGNETTTSGRMNKTSKNDFDSTKTFQPQEMELTRLPQMQNEKVSVKSDIVECAKLMKPNIDDKENFIDSKMDFTCVVKSNVSTTMRSNFEIYSEKDSEIDKTKSEPMELTHNHTLIDADIKTQVMDFTLLNPNKTLINEKMNESRKSNLVQYVKSLKRPENDNKTICNDSQMEFTCAVPNLKNITRVSNFEIYTEPDESETQEMELENKAEIISLNQPNIVSSELTLKPEINNTTRVSNFEIYTESDTQELTLKPEINDTSRVSNFEIYTEPETEEIELQTPAENISPKSYEIMSVSKMEYTTETEIWDKENKGTTFDTSLKLISKENRHAQTILELDFTNQTNLNLQDNVPISNSNLNEVKDGEENNSQQFHHALFPPEEMCSPGNVLFSQKIVTPITKITPHSSFQMSLPPISPYTDDTQLLIHCTYIKTFSDSTSSNKQSDLKENSKLIADAETSIEPDLTNTVHLPLSKLSTVNDTYCLISKSAQNTVQIDDSLGVLSTSLMENELITKPSSDSKLSLPSLNEFIDEPFDFKSRLAIFDYTLPKVDSDLIAKVNAQSELIRKNIENFEFRKLVCPKFEPFDFKLVNVEQEAEIDEKSPIELSLHDKILNRQGSQQTWKYQKQDGDFYYFSNFFEYMEFIAHINENNSLVKNFEIKPLKDTISSIGRFAAKYIIQRMENVASALGSKYDLMSLLDFVEITTSNVIDVLIELDVIGPAVELEFNSDATVATFSVLSFFLMTEFKISVDITDIDNTNQENVSIDIIMGTNRSEVENLAKNSKKGLCFLPGFIRSLTEYIDLREEIYLKK